MKQLSTFFTRRAHIAALCLSFYFFSCSLSWGQSVGFLSNAGWPIFCKQSNGINLERFDGLLGTQTGAFGTGNVFTAQLVDANGNFVANVGTSTSTDAVFSIGLDQAAINNIPVGTTYKLRIVSSNPVVQSALSSSFVTVDNMTTSSSVFGRISGTQTIAPGQNAIITLVLTGGSPYSHQLSDGSGSAGGGGISGYIKNPASTTTYTFNYVWAQCVRGVGEGSATVTVTSTCTQPTLQAATSASSYCSGETINLFGSGGTSYSWSGPNGFNSNTQDPTRTSAQVSMGGVYSLTVTNSNCTATPTASTTVSVSINAASISGTTTYCVGQAISLTASGGSTYSWSGPGGFTSTSNIASITATTALKGTYTVTVSNSSNCSASASIYVNVLANQPIGIITQPISQTKCQNGTVTFSVETPFSEINYQWRKNGENIQFATSSTFSISDLRASNAGTYDVVVFAVCRITETSNPAILTIKNTFEAKASTVTCVGAPLQLSGTSGATTGSYWRGPDGFFSFFARPIIANMSSSKAGVYSLTVVSQNCTSSATISVSVPASQEASVSSNSPVCVGSAIKLSSNIVGSKYQWSGPNSFKSTKQNPTISASKISNGGVYSLTVTSSNFCVSSGTTSVSVQNCGASRIGADEISESGQIKIEVWENPSQGKLQVKINLTEAEPIHLIWTDTNGQPLQIWDSKEAMTQHRLELDIEKYKDGLYLLQVQSPSRQKTVKVWRKE